MPIVPDTIRQFLMMLQQEKSFLLDVAKRFFSVIDLNNHALLHEETVHAWVAGNHEAVVLEC